MPQIFVREHPGVVWRPLTGPVSLYPWSVLWRADDGNPHVHAVVSCAEALSGELNWLDPAGQPDG